MIQPKFKVGDVVRIKYTNIKREGKRTFLDAEQRFHIVTVICEECLGGQQNHYHGRVYHYRILGEDHVESVTNGRLDRFNESELEEIV